MPIRAVIFDFGNTLAVPEDSFGLTVACLSEMGLPAPPERVRELLAAEAEAHRLADSPLETDWVKCRAFYTDRSRVLLAGLGVGGNLDAKAAWLTHLYEARSLARTPHVGCLEALAALRGRYRLAVLSNSDGRVAARCAAMGIADGFEMILDSALLGVSKPDPAIFRVALDRLGLPAGEVVSVGDSFRNDVASPASLGLRTVYVNAAVPPPADPPVRPDAVLTTLHELPAALERLG
jgi:putative hydrolase of the HAD superfamily